MPRSDIAAEDPGSGLKQLSNIRSIAADGFVLVSQFPNELIPDPYIGMGFHGQEERKKNECYG